MTNDWVQYGQGLAGTVSYRKKTTTYECATQKGKVPGKSWIALLQKIALAARLSCFLMSFHSQFDLATIPNQLARSEEVDQGENILRVNMASKLSMMDMRQTVSANYRFRWNPTLPELMHPEACA